MAKFDFVECASKSYEYTWSHKEMIMRMSLLALAIKFVTFAFIITFNLEHNYLRQGLILLPAYFAEGWVVAQIVFMALNNEQDSGYKVPENNFKNAPRNMIASTIIYVLLKVAMSVAIGTPQAFISPEAAQKAQEMAEAQPSEPSSLMFLALCVGLFAAFWAFRYLWLYVPVILGFSVKDFLFKIRYPYCSIYMIATWLFIMIPAGIVMVIVSGLVGTIFVTGDGEISSVGTIIITCIQAGFDYIIILMSSLAMAYGVASIFNKEDKNVSLF